MLLYLVRHGQTPWNLQGRILGQTIDAGLTQLGWQQAQQARDDLVARLDGRMATALLSSDLPRARQTAQVIAAGLRLPVELTADLREQALGELEGRLGSELEPQPVPDGVDISEVCWGGGESIEAVHARMTGFVAGLRTRFSDDAELVLVGHADSLRVLLAVVNRRGHRDVEWIPLANGQVVAASLPPC